MPGWICPRCLHYPLQDNACSCGISSPFLEALFALVPYDARWRPLLHRFKYKGRRSLARPLGYWLGQEYARRQPGKLDLVVPLPLHPDREKERGFNQSRLLADHAARALGVPRVEALERSRATPSQTMLSRRDRRLNVREAFRLVGPLKKGQKALLIDDIFSTGATLQEGAAVLSKEGIRVTGAVVAYNPGTF